MQHSGELNDQSHPRQEAVHLGAIPPKPFPIWEAQRGIEDPHGGLHARHTRTVNLTIAVLSELGVKPWVVEGAGQRFKAGHGDLVITVGGKCRESFAAAKWRANRSSNGPMLPDLYDTKELAMEALASPANAQSSSESDGFLELGLPGGHGSDLQYHMVSIPILS